MAKEKRMDPLLAAQAGDKLAKLTSSAIDAHQQYQRGSITSLVEFIKPSLIESPLFLQDSLAEEPVVNDTIKNLYNIYIGYILVSLQMNEMVTGNRNVRDIIGTVATTESFNAFIDHKALADGLGGCMSAALETLTAKQQEALNNEVDEAKRKHAATKPTGSSSASHFSEKAPQSIASGRQIEVEFGTGDSSAPIKIMMNVKFNTRLIPEAVVEYILNQDFTQSIYNRWLQLRSGEIRFIKDFIFGVDKLHRQEKALKHDKDHTLSDLLKHKTSATVKKFNNMFAAFSGKAPKSYNIANSVLILDEATVDQYTKRNGFSFTNIHDRKRFFSQTYNLFIVLIDTRYSRVTIYTNGIDQPASYSFNEMKASATSDKMSLKEVMDYLSKSQMPKF